MGTEKRRITASEREAAMRMNVAITILNETEQALTKRFDIMPKARQYVRTCVTMMNKVLEMFKETVPEDQYRTYNNNCRMASYWIGVRRPVNTGGETNEKDYGIWVPFETLNAILDASHDHCQMCTYDTAEQRKCKLRKHLDVIPNDVNHNKGDCPYFTL